MTTIRDQPSSQSQLRNTERHKEKEEKECEGETNCHRPTERSASERMKEDGCENERDGMQSTLPFLLGEE